MKTEENENDYQDWSDIIENKGRNLGNKVFIQSLDQGKQITFGEMNEYCNRVAGFLRDRQIKSGDKVTLIGKNTIETLTIYFGVLKYGAIVNPVFFEESEDNLYRLINMVRPQLIFYDIDLRLDTARYTSCEWICFSEYEVKHACLKETQMMMKIPPNSPLYQRGARGDLTPLRLSRSDSVRGKGLRGDFQVKKAESNNFFQQLKVYDPVFEGCIAGKEDVGVILYTSGTTEVPKGIHISREGLFYMVDEISDRTGMTETDRVLEYRAYNWASVQLLTILSSMFKGATLFLAKRFSRSRFPDWLKKYDITISSGVPAVINMLINEPVPLHKGEAPWLKYITSSSAPLTVESHLKFEEIYGIPINQMMGMSEAGWMAGNPPQKRKVGSVGLPLKHKEISFLNEQGKQCRPGEKGEMIVKGKAMGLCYSKEDGTIERFPEEGFATGDLGYMDEDGYIYITGRKKDLIIRGGINISPMEITSRILEHPAISEAATIGVPDKIYGEEVVCFVVAKQGCTVDEREVICHCENSLPQFKTPKRVFVIHEIPKTQRGKVSRADMLRLYETQTGKLPDQAQYVER